MGSTAFIFDEDKIRPADCLTCSCKRKALGGTDGQLGYMGGFPGGSVVNNPLQRRRHSKQGFDPWVGKIPWRGAWQPTRAFLPKESHGESSVVGFGHRVAESDTTKATKRALEYTGALGAEPQSWHSL